LESEGWRHPSFVQIWGPRGAAYLVRRYDLAPLTLGRLPRDPRALDDLHKRTDAAVAVLSRRDEADQLELRRLAVTGRFLLEWDTRTSMVRVVAPPEVDVEQSRLELARRFLRVFAPATVADFATWAGINAAEARETWARLAGLTTVQVEGAPAQVLALPTGATERFVRLLPAEDPFLRLGRAALAGRYVADVFPKHPTTVIRGAVVDTGRVVGWWQRRGGRVAITPLVRGDWLELAEAEAWALPIPGAISDVQINLA
jgi:hypothetical protein